MTSSELKTKSPLELYPKLLQISKQWTQCADCDDKHPKWAEIIRGILIWYINPTHISLSFTYVHLYFTVYSAAEFIAVWALIAPKSVL